MTKCVRGFVLALLGMSAAGRVGAQEMRPESVKLTRPEVVVPMEIALGRPVVEVFVGKAGPYKFVLDTGAGGTIVDADLADELKLETTGWAQVGDPLKPQGVAARRVRIDALSIGGATFSGVTATRMERFGLREHLGASGILGMPLFAELLLTVDYQGRQVRLREGALPPVDGENILPFHIGYGGTSQMMIEVGGKTLDAAIDTGSPRGVSLPDKYMEELSFEDKPVEVGRARTVSAEFVVHQATLKGAVKIGGHILDKLHVQFNALPGANLGGEVLSRFVFTIDQKQMRVEFLEAKAPGSERASRTAKTAA